MTKAPVKDRVAQKVAELQSKRAAILSDRDQAIAVIDAQLAGLADALSFLKGDLETAVNKLVDLELL